MATIPTPIVDKNGKQTTVHKGRAKTAGSNRAATVNPVQVAVVKERTLSSEEVREAVDNLDYNYSKDRDERSEQRKENTLKTKALEERWGRGLQEEYAYDLPDVAHAEIFQKAWEDGHSSGYGNVEHHYQDLSEMVRKIVRAVK